MKNKIFISVVLAVILAATMSVGCFAYEAIWSLSDNDYVADSYSGYPMAIASRSYSYHSYSMILDCSLSVQSLPVTQTRNCSSNIVYGIWGTSFSYSNIRLYYDLLYTGPLSFDDYILIMAEQGYNSYTLIYSDVGNYTTGSVSVSKSPLVSTGYLYYFKNTFNSYYQSLYSGQLNNNVAFCLESNIQPHIYYN